MDLYRTEYSHYLLALTNHRETQTTLSKQLETLSKNKIALEKLSKAASVNDRRYYSLSIAKVARDMLEVQLKM